MFFFYKYFIDLTEVTFVRKTTTGDIEYYQVAWQMISENTMAREFGALEKIIDNYTKYLLTTDSFTQDRSGIHHLNVFNWLFGINGKPESPVTIIALNFNLNG